MSGTIVTENSISFAQYAEMYVGKDSIGEITLYTHIYKEQRLEWASSFKNEASDICGLQSAYARRLVFE